MPVCHAGVSENRLYRTLRAAVQIGLFEAVMPKKGEGHVQFKNNRRSALLREGHPNCLKHMVRVSAVHRLSAGALNCVPAAPHVCDKQGGAVQPVMLPVGLSPVLQHTLPSLLAVQVGAWQIVMSVQHGQWSAIYYLSLWPCRSCT